MPIDFPDSPTLNQVYTSLSGRSWQWDGTRWVSFISSSETYVQDLVSQQVDVLVDSAPTTLDTLNELAAALSDDPSFATTVAGQIGSIESDVDALQVANISIQADLNTKASTGKAIAMAIVFGG